MLKNKMKWEQPAEFTEKLATQTISRGSWYCYIVAVIDHYYAIVTEGH